MSRVVMLTAVLLGLLLAPGAPAAGEEEERWRLEDFAYSAELAPRSGAAVHAVRLPMNVYRQVVRADLGDLRIFNGDGQQVPHAVRTLDGDSRVQGHKVAIPIFPLRGVTGAPDDREAMLQAEDLQVHIERAAAGTIIDIRTVSLPTADAGSPDAGLQQAREPIDAYLIDLRSITSPVVALWVEFEPTQDDYVLPLTLETSERLADYLAVSGTHALASLRYAGHHVHHARLRLPAVVGGYVRITWPDGSLPAPVRAVSAELGATTEEAKQDATMLQGVQREGEVGVYDFELGGPAPVDRIRIVLPEDNTLIAASLSSRDSESDQEVAAYQGHFYRLLHDGQSIESEPVNIARRRHRTWTLRVDRTGGGLGGGTPRLEVSRHPEQLLFVGRGPAPYHLAFGHHSATGGQFTPKELLSMLPIAARDTLTTSDAHVGAIVERAGDAGRIRPAPPPPYKRYLLWAVLIVGVLLVGMAALRLARGLD